MKTEIISNEFENGKRICTQKVTYNKSDDLFTLANYQKRYEKVCSQIAEATEETDVEFLQLEKAELETAIAAQEGIVNSYGSEE